MSDFEEIRKQQVAKQKPSLWCVISLRYQDVHLVSKIEVCFFSKEEAIIAMEWMDKENPIPKAVGWYEIDESTLSIIEG